MTEASFLDNRREIDLVRQELRLRGHTVTLGGRAFEIFAILVQAAGRLVTKDEIMERAWRGTVVEENRIQVQISAIRRALGPDRELLKTTFGRGYRLLGDWKIHDTATIAASASDVTMGHAATGHSAVVGAELIGRESATADLLELLATCRSVTLTGPGGIGKTALAQQVARRLLPEHGGGCFADLSALTEPALVPSVLANALNLKVEGADISSTAVARAIGPEKLFVVLDNCEHVIAAAADLAETVLRLCPNIALLATSREVLRIEGEHVYRVAPLDVPDAEQRGFDAILASSAVQLFVLRAQAADGAFTLDADSAPAVGAICRRLDGIPLGIEFAAARAGTLGVAQVALLLDDRFRLLTSGRRTALPRRQTMRAVLDWSYELLPEHEQQLFRSLAVFAGGFTLEAVMALLGQPKAPAAPVIDDIESLISKSLIVPDRSARGNRWRLLETIRGYVLEKLQEHGEAGAVARRHAALFRDLVAPAGFPRSLLSSAVDLAHYGLELDNVRAALDWAFSPGGEASVGVALTAGYVPVWLNMMLLGECRDRTEQALESLESYSSGDDRLDMLLLITFGTALLHSMATAERTLPQLEKALVLSERLGDFDTTLRALWAMWSFRYNRSEHRKALALAARFLEVADRKGVPDDAMVGHRMIGTSLHLTGDQAGARHHLQIMLGGYAAPPDGRHLMWFHNDQRVIGRIGLARVLSVQGSLDRAWQEAQQIWAEAEITGRDTTIRYVLGSAVCPIALLIGDLAAVERAVEVLIELGKRQSPYWQAVGIGLKGILAVRRGDFDAGITLVRSALEHHDFLELLAALSEGAAGLGKAAEALVTIDGALARAERLGAYLHVPELMRIKGELLLQATTDPSSSEGESWLLKAIAAAQRQGALLWELRAALALARLRMRQGHPDEARRVVATVFGQFTEGFEAVDLREARSLLQA